MILTKTEDSCETMSTIQSAWQSNEAAETAGKLGSCCSLLRAGGEADI